MLGEVVLVQYLGEWRQGTLLWDYVDTGRPRGLIRFETPSGIVVRQLRWLDEIVSVGRILELPLIVPPVSAS